MADERPLDLSPYGWFTAAVHFIAGAREPGAAAASSRFATPAGTIRWSTRIKRVTGETVNSFEGETDDLSATIPSDKHMAFG
jgi:hypothetical protein